jgi:hypothetical protein
MSTDRRFAWVGFALGTTVSIAANILHAAHGDKAGADELIGAAFWPIALMLSVEILTRRDSSRDPWWKSLGLAAGLVVVAGVAAFLSYMHMAALLASWGEGPGSAHLGPLAVDGLMLVSGLALLPVRQPAGNGDRPHVFTWPEPIGPVLSPQMILSRLEADMDDLAGTAYAGPVAPAPVYADNQAHTPLGDAALASILERIPTATAAPLNGHSQPVKASTTSSRPRRTAAKPADGKSQVRAWFDAEVAAGRTPTGPEIAEKAGRDRRTGTRWLADFTAAGA